MKVPGLNIIVPDNPNGGSPHTSIQAAINEAAAAPGWMVWVPPSYTGTDTYNNPSKVVVLDFRGGNFLVSGQYVDFRCPANKFNDNALVSHGLIGQIAHVDFTNQSAALSASAISTSLPNTGFFRFSWHAKVVQAATSSSQLGGSGGMVLNFTSGIDSTALSITTTITGSARTGNDLATGASGSMTFYAKVGTAVTADFGYSSSGATPMLYTLHTRIEDL